MIEEFASEARRFVHWLTKQETTTPLSPDTTLQRLLALYAKGLNLPHPLEQALHPDSASNLVSHEEVQRVYQRAETLPVRTYFTVLDPLAHLEYFEEEPVLADTADDLADIFREIQRGLRLFESGRQSDALWEWTFGLEAHWGQHATSLIRVLDRYLARRNQDNLL